MAISVALGALGAHALKSVLTPDQLASFHTGVQYQAWHSLALLLLQCLPGDFASRRTIKVASMLLVLGILFFSFSIYLLSLRDVLGLGAGVSVIGPVTPLGGTLFIGAWILIGISLLRPQSV